MMRPPITADRAIGSDRNRSITPRWKSVFSASAVVNGRKHTLWTGAGQGELQVLAAGTGDRAAEDVDEQHEEHDRLDRHLHELLGRRLDVQQVPPGDRERVRDDVAVRGRAMVTVLMPASFRRARRRRPSRAGSTRSARWPVSARKTSSRLGRRSDRSSTAMPASSRRGTAVPSAARSSMRQRDDLPVVERGLPAFTERREDLLGRGEVVGLGRPRLQHLAADPGLELLAACRPRSPCPWSITTISSASRSASSRYCVVSSTVVPSATSAADHAPQLEPAPRVEAGRGLVEVEEPRASRRGSRRGRAADACRPSTSSRTSSPRRRGRTPRAARRPAPGLATPEAEQPPDHDEVLLAREQLVDRRVLAGQADQAAHLGGRRRRRSRRPTRGRRRAWSSVESTRIAVVLPAPFGPSSPNTVPSRATMSMPSSARTSPKVLTRPSASIARSSSWPPPPVDVRSCDRSTPPCRPTPHHARVKWPPYGQFP